MAGPSATRYAQAAFQLADEADRLDEWLADLKTVAESLQHKELAAVLDSPRVPLDKKLAVIDEVLGGEVDRLTRNLVALLASRNAASTVPEVADRFGEMVDARRGIVRGEVTSAVPLSDKQLAGIKETLKGIAGADVRLSTRVDPAIVAGFVARVGDRVIDGSARTKLKEMRRALAR